MSLKPVSAIWKIYLPYVCFGAVGDIFLYVISHFYHQCPCGFLHCFSSQSIYCYSEWTNSTIRVHYSFWDIKAIFIISNVALLFFLKRWYHPKNQGFIATKKDYVFLDWPLSLWWKSDYPWVPEITWDRIPLIDGTLAHSLLLLFCKRLAVWLFIEELLYVCFVEKKNQGVFMGCSL